MKVENVKGEIKLIGKSALKLKKEAVNEVEFFIVVDKKDIHQRKTNLVIGLYQNGEKVGTVKTNFLGPFI
jgi:predicted Zn-dependent protease